MIDNVEEKSDSSGREIEPPPDTYSQDSMSLQVRQTTTYNIMPTTKLSAMDRTIDRPLVLLIINIGLVAIKANEFHVDSEIPYEPGNCTFVSPTCQGWNLTGWSEGFPKTPVPSIGLENQVSEGSIESRYFHPRVAQSCLMFRIGMLESKQPGTLTVSIQPRNNMHKRLLKIVSICTSEWSNVSVPVIFSEDPVSISIKAFRKEVAMHTVNVATIQFVSTKCDKLKRKYSFGNICSAGEEKSDFAPGSKETYFVIGVVSFMEMEIPVGIIAGVSIVLIFALAGVVLFVHTKLWRILIYRSQASFKRNWKLRSRNAEMALNCVPVVEEITDVTIRVSAPFLPRTGNSDCYKAIGAQAEDTCNRIDSENEESSGDYENTNLYSEGVWKKNINSN